MLYSGLATAKNCDYIAGPPDAGRASVGTLADDNNSITTAWFGGATTRYAHGVLGDKIEAHTLYALTGNTTNCAYKYSLHASSVFEDLTPRIADVTGDGENEVIVIESHQDKGASLAVYGIKKQRLVKIASTPPIGQAWRWLAPAGIADFNNDGVDDVAYVQTPHIDGILKIWSFKTATAKLLASQGGFSNHKIGDNFITGGLHHCDGKPFLVLPDRQWQHTLVAHMRDGLISSKAVAAQVDEATINHALQQCPLPGSH